MVVEAYDSSIGVTQVRRTPEWYSQGRGKHSLFARRRVFEVYANMMGGKQSSTRTLQ
jgi:hypothetical protein